MKTVLICVSRIDSRKVDGQEYQKTIISEKMWECFSIPCALSFFLCVFKAAHALFVIFLSLKLKYCRNLLISSKLARHSLGIFMF